MSLLDCLLLADWPTVLASFGSRSFFMAMGTCDALAFVVGLAALGACWSKCIRREGSWLPLLLGLVALLLGVLGYVISWHSVHSFVEILRAPPNRADMVAAASRAMVGLLFCAAIFLVGVAGSGLTMALSKGRRKTGAEA